MWSSWTRRARPGRHEGTAHAEAPATLARRRPGPPGRPLDPRVDGRPVRPLRPGEPARAAGPLHRAPRPRRHRARVPGRPQRHDRLALGDDGRDARGGAGPGRSTCSWPATPTAGSATSAGRSSCWRTASTPPGSRSSCATGGSSRSDPHDWDELIREAAGAEKYSRRLSERITDGYAAKFDHRDDPGGHAGLGFRRLRRAAAHPRGRPRHDRHRRSRLFERYALGNVSAKDLAAETGLAESRIRMILMNPIYNGWIRRLPPEPRRDAQAGAVARRPAGLRRAVGAGRGRPAVEDPRRRPEAR